MASPQLDLSSVSTPPTLSVNMATRLHEHRDLPIPGTIVLVDVDGGMTNQQHDGPASDIILSPVPSNDVNDPLRWTHQRKMLQVAMLVIYTLSTGMASASLYSVLTPISENTGIPVSTLNAGTGYMFLLLGWGALITQPLALAFGKRPVYLITGVCHLGTVFWMIWIKSESEWLANKVLQGFFAAPIESLVEISFADVFYAHERGFYIGLYGMALFTSNFVAPIWAGFVNDALGYKWVFWVSGIQLAAALVILFLFMEETNYERGTTELAEKHTVDRDSAQTDIEVVAESKGDSSSEGKTLDFEEKWTESNMPAYPHQLEGTPYTWLQRLRLFRRRPWLSYKTMFTMMYRPILLLRFPVVFWSGFIYGAALVWFNVLNATSSMIFTGTYNFSASMVGLAYFGPTIGAILAWVWSGWIADKFSIFYARRNKGIREPEERLWLLTMNTIILPAGLILWGVGAAHHVHWFGLVVGFMLIAFTSATGGAFAINYALDSYKDLGGEVMVTVMIIRNSLSFAIGYGITPWLSMGYQNTFITAAMVGMAIYASFLIVVKYGKVWRAKSRKAYWGYVETSVMAGH